MSKKSRRQRRKRRMEERLRQLSDANRDRITTSDLAPSSVMFETVMAALKDLDSYQLTRVAHKAAEALAAQGDACMHIISSLRHDTPGRKSVVRCSSASPGCLCMDDRELSGAYFVKLISSETLANELQAASHRIPRTKPQSSTDYPPVQVYKPSAAVLSDIR